MITTEIHPNFRLQSRRGVVPGMLAVRRSTWVIGNTGPNGIVDFLNKHHVAVQRFELRLFLFGKLGAGGSE